ncbi:MAG: hypothetical protein NC823_01775, partial [Candidatus Omnitrophica bacterium]|nr:hypothetical protein [Candidatus Omnitrophota bacterium]
RFSPPRPDFSVFVVPSGLTSAAGRPVPLLFQAIRYDGFDGPIELSLCDSESGFSLQSPLIPPRQNRVRCTLTGPMNPSPQPVPLVFKATAVISGKKVEHQVCPADEWEQAFSYKHLVPAAEFLTLARRAWTPFAGCQVVGELPVRLVPGQSTQLTIKTPVKIGEEFSYQLLDPPAGLVLEKTVREPGNLHLFFQTAPEAEKQVGLANNLILEVIREVAAGNGKKTKTLVGYLPAIPFYITKP